MNRDAKIGVVVILIIVGLVVIIWGRGEPEPETAEVTVEDASTPPAGSLEPDFGFEDTPFEEMEPGPKTKEEPPEPAEEKAAKKEEPDTRETEEAAGARASKKDTDPARHQIWVYTVKRGDTLSEIAERELGRTRRYTEVAELNHLAKPYRIRVGQKLKMPPRGTTDRSTASAETAAERKTPTVVGKKKYVVRQQDIKDVMEIARQRLGDWQEWRTIAELSGLRPPFRIRAGDVLWLPIYE
ncbi:MAG: LysM peptidoglycan-binding domain-containing protein [bacterium]